VRRLQEYERFKTAGESMESLPRVGRDLFIAQARPEVIPVSAKLAPPSLRELLMAFRDVMQRSDLFTRHQISREPLSVRERMSHVLARLHEGARSFQELVDPEEGRAGVVVCFLAILELAKSELICIVQDLPFEPVLIDVARPQAAVVENEND
ncbi:MAG: segregation and condensation protein A, partial [Stenotrophobium sp.]